MKSFLDRFFLDFGVPRESENLRFVLYIIEFRTHRPFEDRRPTWIDVGLDFGAQKATKIEPERLPEPFGNEVEILSNFEVVFEGNFAST